jgi:predicted alpha-1,2-mannosidase
MNLKTFIISLIFSLIQIFPQTNKLPADYVNPFIGTKNMGHTFPGAVVPFGMVQLSPETDTVMYSYGSGYNPDVYRYCAGYQYDDQTIVGFSHTHFNGTGHSDLGDFLIMPMVGKLFLNPGTKDHPEKGYRSKFSHQNEEATAGYYKVELSDYNVTAELTATERTGFHKYTFPKSDSSHIILDLTSGIYNYDGKVVWASLRVENDTLITGYRQTNGWARSRYIYFAMTISKPFKSYGLQNKQEMLYRGFWRKFNENLNFPERAGEQLVAHFDFDTDENEVIMIKLALSAVSTKNAIENLQFEIPHWDFDKVKNEAKQKWNKELSKIIIEADEERKVNFYTSMYHSFTNPVIYNDVNGEYRGLDQNIYQAEGFTNYTIFSLWDIYRALHPLYTIIQQKRTNDIINSMLAHYDQSVHKILPVWSHYSNENWCMIGYHAVSVIVDAYLKDIKQFDVNKAFDAVISSSNYDVYDGIGYYKKYGFIPEDLNSNSVSKTLEYAYDDWTIYRFAEALGKTEIAETYFNRSKNYKNLFDPVTRFIRAKKSDGEFLNAFDPLSTVNQGYIEGNAWNYSLYVPHDIKGLSKLVGGKAVLVKWIDSLFTMHIAEEKYAHSEDLNKVGMIGNYVHGNEPSHQIPYMYNYLGAAWKTQEKVNLIVNTMYKNKPDGLSGNDDCGQMSAWYIFSLLGFYPVAPGSNQYVIGTPGVKSAKIFLENGNLFEIEAENLDENHFYIDEAFLNGKRLDRTYLTHQEIMLGGKLKFVLKSTPNYEWGTGDNKLPYSLTE